MHCEVGGAASPKSKAWCGRQACWKRVPDHRDVYWTYVCDKHVGPLRRGGFRFVLADEPAHFHDDN